MVLEGPLFAQYFEKVQATNFEVASDAFQTFKDLLTRHKSLVGAYLNSHYDEVRLQDPQALERRGVQYAALSSLQWLPKTRTPTVQFFPYTSDRTSLHSSLPRSCVVLDCLYSPDDLSPLNKWLREIL